MVSFPQLAEPFFSAKPHTATNLFTYNLYICMT